MKQHAILARGTPWIRWRTAWIHLSPSAFALFVLYGFLLLWVWLAIDAVGTSSGPNGADFGVDFSHTYAAVHVLSAGHNPYDFRRLSATQHVLLSTYGLSVQPPSHAVLVGTSTFFLWILRPIDAFPFQAIAIAWMLLTYVLVGFVFWALLRHFGWRRRCLPTFIFLATPAVSLGIFYGNMIGLAFAAIAGAFPLLRRYPFLAGVVLSVSMLKPQVALPIAALIVLFQAPYKGRVIAGFVTAFLGRHLIAIVLLGPAYQGWWLESFVNFSRTMQLQPNLTSLTGFYSDLVPQTVRFGLELTSIALAGVITLAFWWRVRSQSIVPLQKTGWLWFLWMLATPYAHFIDEIVLVIPVLALIGVNGRHVTRPTSVVVLYLLGLSIWLFSWTPMNVQLLWAPLVLCGGCFALAAYRSPAEETAAVVHQPRGRARETLDLVPLIAR